MSEALWFAGLAVANFWMAGSLGYTSNTEKGMLGGAAVGTGAGALVGRGNSTATPPLSPDTDDGTPTTAEILRVLPNVTSIPHLYEETRDVVEVTTEKILDRIDPQRFFPMVGPAQLHHRHWKCTVHFTETVEVAYPFPMKTQRKRVELVYIDKDRLIPCAAQEKLGGVCTEQTVGTDVRIEAVFYPNVQMADDSLNPNQKIPGLTGRVWLLSKTSKHSVNADGTITVEMYDQNPAALGKPQLLSVWTLDAAALMKMRQEDKIGPFYTLFLPCDPEAAHVNRVKLEVKYTPNAGRCAFAQSTVLNLSYMKSPAEERTEYGPPILSKIPYLSRLFRNAAYEAPLARAGQTEESAAPPASYPAAPLARKYFAANERTATSTAAQVQLEVVVAKVDPAAWGMLFLSRSGQEGVRFEVLTGKEKMIGALMALRSKGQAKIMAEPRLLTLSGRPGSFVIGGQMPIFVSGGEGAPRVEYKQIGATINVLPVVQANGRIHLDVTVELAELADALNIRLSNGVVVPGFNVASAQSATIIKDGETLVVTGESMRLKGGEQHVILLTARVIQPACCDAKPASAMTLTDVARLARRGISEDIILRQMELTEATFRLAVEDILSLHEQGVSENIIRVIQMRSMGGR